MTVAVIIDLSFGAQYGGQGLEHAHDGRAGADDDQGHQLAQRRPRRSGPAHRDGGRLPARRPQGPRLRLPGGPGRGRRSPRRLRHLQPPPRASDGADVACSYRQRGLRSLSFPGNRSCCSRSCYIHWCGVRRLVFVEGACQPNPGSGRRGGCGDLTGEGPSELACPSKVSAAGWPARRPVPPVGGPPALARSHGLDPRWPSSPRGVKRARE